MWMTAPSDERPRAGRWDTLAVWLHIYAAPSDAEVPPVPVRKIVAAGIVGLIAVAAAALLIVPAIDRGKDRGRRREASADAAIIRRERRRIVLDQRAHVAAVRPGRPGGDSIAGRAAVLERARHAIGTDARGRVRAGRLTGRIRSVRCTPLPAGTRVHPERRLDLRFGRYDCVAITEVIARSRLNEQGALGYPFRLAVDFGARRFGWCMVDPPAGEASAPDPRQVPQPPAACTSPRSLVPR
jgi:hypothetical protein